MDEQSCPRCKSTTYRNKNLKLLVNVCGHKLCQTCVDVLFTRPSAACPQCNTVLRRSDFRMQQFEDALVEREVDIRRRIVKIYNKLEEDFPTLREFNDYLEQVEIIIFNLANKVNVDETRRKIETYKKENERTIRKNNSRITQEEYLLKASLESEIKDAEEKRKQLIQDQRDVEKQKLKDKESLINDLIYANAPADEVIARHLILKQQQQKEEEKEKKSFFFSAQNKANSANAQPIVIAPLYEYKETHADTFGPKPPVEIEIKKNGYLNHIRGATSSEKAGGYTESLACRRAIQDAFNCLYM